ncbi:MAG: hypothetical protein CMP84_02865 [Gammaproteobacteria bacterium]|nr:hypothetical protein [Gammaproteobacteria bacterium]
MTVLKPQLSPATLVFARLLAIGLLSGWTLLMAQSGFAGVLLEIMPAANGPDLPVEAIETKGVRIDAVQIARLEPRSVFDVEIAANRFVEFTVTDVGHYLNGDKHISAGAQAGAKNYSMTLTVGAARLFGYLSADTLVWQVDALRDAEVYQGWAYLPAGLPAAELNNDYFIPPSALVPPPLRSLAVPVQALKVGGGDGALTAREPQNASLPNFSASKLQISQSFEPDPVIAGGTADAVITLKNISSEAHENLVLEVFFVLEDSALAAASPGCSEQLSLSLQKVLHCTIGNLAPSETRQLGFSISIAEAGVSYLASSIVVGDLRHDLIINVVKDIRTDSDQDGISDFNESLLATDPRDSSSVDYSEAVIDVLSLYTPSAIAAYPGAVETRINQLFGVANQIYRESKVGIRLRPVHLTGVATNESADMDTALTQLMAGAAPEYAGVEALRSRFGADLVILFSTLEPVGSRCGLAPVGGFKTNGYFSPAIERALGYSVIAVDCPVELVVAHELGHNMGLTHSHLEEGAGGTYNFSTGYGVEAQFVTVMATPAAFHTDNHIARFSDPERSCAGAPCGLQSEATLGSDAVQSLNLVRHQIANFTPSTVPDLPRRQVASTSGESTAAAIAVAASKDEGLSFSEVFTPSDRVSISANILLDPKHVGKVGTLHVLVGLKGEADLYQLNSNAELERWDGQPETMFPLAQPRILNAEENLLFLHNYQFSSALAGLDLVVYVAYQIPGSGVLIYTASPMPLRVVL